jgi:glucosamine--fructose-6-phosphate aminotransferase (isomerizing)
MTRAAEATSMFREAGESPAAVARMLAENGAVMRALCRRLEATPPAAAITCARGSSDNAATYGRYLVETRIGLVTGSLGLSVASVYRAPLRLRDVLCVAVSQSGASPDLLAAMEQARRSGAITVAMVNVADSPLAAAADHVVALSAGPETSVAATKSFIASLAAFAWLVGAWAGDADLLAGVERLPDLLRRAWACDWSAALPVLAGARGAIVLGRGPGLAAAQEAALKLKETCRIHAEALSAAEVEHGPMALAGPDLPVLAFAQDDPSRALTVAVAMRLIGRGAPTVLAGAEGPGALALPAIPAHPLLQPLLLTMAFYRLAAELSLARGMDPDHPPHLQKVTRTW